tara:strand:- start:2213 stop:3157 length:945 start_codon:yes stop_codon:yes gene_type:complete
MVTKKCQKRAPIFLCKECNFETSKKSNYDKHLLTAKHKMVTNGNKKMPKNAAHICEWCLKEYKHASGLSRHMKKCRDEINEEKIELEKEEPDNIVTNTVSSDQVVELIRQNHEFKDLLVEQHKQNQELQKQLLDVAKEGKTINNNCNQTNNFNLNFFLNEQCKNAINLMDFVNSLDISIEDIKETGKLGYVDGIGRIFVRALNDLDVTERPIHCTDIKRETVYVKDQDKWEIDNVQKPKLKDALFAIEKKNLDMLPEWQEKNPSFKEMDTQENNDFIQISMNSLGPDTREEKERQQNKIIKNVLKEVIVDKKKP